MEEGNIFLEEYEGQSIEQLIELQKTHRIDSIVLAIESALDTRKEKEEQLNSTELTVLAVEAFERELNNGGFSQFFYNSSVEYTPIIASSLAAIGCNQIASLAQRAINLLNVESTDLDGIEALMESEDEQLEDSLAELDDIFYELGEPIADRLFEFIRSNQDSIKLQS